MPRSKKIFFFVAAVFLVLVIYATYDFSRRTTFPGSVKKPTTSADTLGIDSLATDTL